MMSKECNDLFDELCDYTDDPCIMNEFVECMKTWVIDWNKGNIRIGLINLSEIDDSFGDSLYIAYDDCGGCSGESIWNPFEFVEYIQGIYNDYAEDLCPEGYWINALKGILYDGYEE